MDTTICNVTYLDRNIIKPVQDIQRNYLREQISQYGIEVSYFRSEANWFKTSGSQTSNVQNYIYGDSPNANYFKIADMVVYIEIANDEILNSKFGFNSNSDGTLYILINDFANMYRNVLGYENTINVNIPVSSNVTRFNGTLTGCSTINQFQSLNFSQQLNYNSFNTYNNDIVIPTDNILICSTTGDNLLYIGNDSYNEYVYNSQSYSNTCQLKCYNVSGVITIPNEIKRYGSGVLCGNLTGQVTYFSEYNEDNILLRPLPGDFIRIQFDEYNHVEYEISETTNQNLTASGINPLLARYTWQCPIIRRIPSFETVDSINQSEEKLSIKNREKLNQALEIISDEVFDYSNPSNYTNDVDDVNSDAIYGGNSRLYSDTIINNIEENYMPDDLQPTTETNHELLTNLLGGNENGHYHLIDEEHLNATRYATEDNDGILSSESYQIFISKQNRITTGTCSQYIKGDLTLGNTSDLSTETYECINALNDYVNNCINQVVNYTDTCVSKLRDYTTTCINEQKSYTDNCSNNAVTISKSYTDSCSNNFQTYTNTCINEQKTYTDTCVSNLKSYTDTCTNTVRIDLIQYTDICSNNLKTYVNTCINEQKTYTDICTSNLRSYINTCVLEQKNYTDDCSFNQLVLSESYTDTCVSSLKDYSNTCINEQKTYTDTCVSNLRSYINVCINEQKGYTDVCISNLKSYTDNCINEQKSYTDTCVYSLRSYSDSCINNVMKLDQTTPQTTIGRFNFCSISVDCNTIYVDNINHRVGIGTIAPTSNLHVVGDVNITCNLYMGDYTTDTSITLKGTVNGATGSRINLYEANLNGGYIAFDGNANTLKIGTTSTTDFPVISLSRSTYDTTFTGAGFFGSSGKYGILRSYIWGQSASSNGLNIYKRGNTSDIDGAVLSSGEIGYHSFYGWDGIGYGRGAYAIVNATENWCSTAHGARYSISTTENGGITETVRLTVQNNGRVGIGTVSPANGFLEVSKNIADGDTLANGVSFAITKTASSAPNAVQNTGLTTTFNTAGSQNFTATNAAMGGSFYHNGAGTLTTQAGLWYIVGATGSTPIGNVGTREGIRVQTFSSGTCGLLSTVTNSYGIRVQNMAQYNAPTTTAGIYIDSSTTAVGTSKYGIYIGDQSGATNNYSIYAVDGTAKSYFGGNVGIGGLPTTSKLSVTGESTFIPATGAQLKIDTSTASTPRLQSYASQALYINELGNNVLLNTNGGNVGIGTITATDKLTVNNSTDATRTTALRLENNFSSVGSGSSIDFDVAATTSTTGRITNLYEATGSGRALTFDNWTGSALTEKMRITGSGNVGIGTNTPKLKLESMGIGGTPAVSGATQTVTSARLSNTSNLNVLDFGNYGSAQALGSWLQATNSNSLVTNYSIVLNPNGGNVGINTTSPTAKLHLPAGSATASSAPIKLTSGTDLTVTEAGVMEYDGTNLHFTNGGLIRRNLSTADYVQSRGLSIITNGSGMMNDNTNFSTWTFDKTDTYSGLGSFCTIGNVSKYNDEFIAVDPTKTYKITAFAKSGDADGSHYSPTNRQYFGIVSYDADGLAVNPEYSTRYLGSVDTTLAVNLNPGDTTITLTDATGWYAGASGSYRHMGWYGYKNSFGYTYPDYTYTRYVSQTHAGLDSQQNGLWAAPVAIGSLGTATWVSSDKSLSRTSGSFVTEGLLAGMTMTSTNVSNPGPFTIATVSALKLTFVEAVVDSSTTTNALTYVGEGITANVIKLRMPWAGPALVAGASVRNSASGGTYQYTVLSYISVPNSWTKYTGYIGSPGQPVPQDYNFRAGTAYVKLLWLNNYSSAADNSIRYSNITMQEVADTSYKYLTSPTADETAYRFDYQVIKPNYGTAYNDTGMVINQIDSNSPGTSKILDIQSNSVSKYYIDNAGIPQLAGSNALPPATGTTFAGSMRISPIKDSTLDFGVYNTSGAGWIQTNKYADFTTHYSLLLNPNGGKVGIGTTSPDTGSTLHVKGSAASGIIVERSSAGANSHIEYRNGTAGSFFAGLSGNNTYGIGIGADLGTAFLTVLNTGKVGIGTILPTYKLEVAGTATADAVRSWSGYDIYYVVKPTYTAANFVLTAGGSNLSIGNYNYMLTYTTALGETDSTTIVPITTDAGNRKVTITLPISTDVRVTGRRIYRSSVGAVYTDYKLVVQISDNVTSSYIDDIPDSSLDATKNSFFVSNSTSNGITTNGTGQFLFPAHVDSSFFAGTLGFPVKATYSGGRNLAVGPVALRALTTGNRNTAIGGSSLQALTTGYQNLGIGYGTGQALTTGAYNINIGHSSGFLMGTTSTSNTHVGVNSGYTNGANKLINYSTGVGFNTNFIGTSYAIHLGNCAGRYETASGKLIIDSIDRTTEALGRTSALIYGEADVTPSLQILSLGGGGKVGIGTITPAEQLDVAGNIHASGSVNAVHKAADGTAAVADGTYTMGIGGTQNGTITIKDGIIVGIQQAI